VPKTALVVDDIPFARKLIKDILIEAKYSVVAEASNGAEAITEYLKHKPDFVTMDLVMPLRGGIEATRNILDKDKNAKVIIITSMVQEQMMMEAINAGARDYILKPFQKQDILNAVEKILKEESENS
jgi:two-component system chemotaxis response regulator CheY